MISDFPSSRRDIFLLFIVVCICPRHYSVCSLPDKIYVVTLIIFFLSLSSSSLADDEVSCMKGSLKAAYSIQYSLDVQNICLEDVNTTHKSRNQNHVNVFFIMRNPVWNKAYFYTALLPAGKCTYTCTRTHTHTDMHKYICMCLCALMSVTIMTSYM